MTGPACGPDLPPCRRSPYRTQTPRKRFPRLPRPCSPPAGTAPSELLPLLRNRSANIIANRTDHGGLVTQGRAGEEGVPALTGPPLPDPDYRQLGQVKTVGSMPIFFAKNSATGDGRKELPHFPHLSILASRTIIFFLPA